MARGKDRIIDSLRGNIAVTGQFEFDKKVGVWSEYHNIPEVVRVKKEIQYPTQFHLKRFKPYVRRDGTETPNLYTRFSTQLVKGIFQVLNFGFLSF